MTLDFSWVCLNYTLVYSRHTLGAKLIALVVKLFKGSVLIMNLHIFPRMYRQFELEKPPSVPKPAIFQALSTDLMVKISEYLSINEWNNFLICHNYIQRNSDFRVYARYLRQDYRWIKNAFDASYPPHDLEKYPNCYRMIYKVASTGRIPYKATYLNWPKIEENVMCRLLLADGRIITGCYSHYQKEFNKQISVWRCDKRPVDYNLEGHGDSVYCLLYLGNNLVASGGGDRTVRIWDLTTRKVMHVLLGHWGSVLCLAKLEGEKIASGGDDFNICIWNINTGKRCNVLRGHTSLVTCLVTLKNGMLASGSRDRTVRIWDPKKSDSLRVLIGHWARINCITELEEGEIASGSEKGGVRIWKSGEETRSLFHPFPVKCILYFNRFIITGSGNLVYIWNRKLKSPRILECHQTAIRHIYALNDEIISESERTVIKWEIDRKRLMKNLTTKQRSSCAIS